MMTGTMTMTTGMMRTTTDSRFRPYPLDNPAFWTGLSSLNRQTLPMVESEAARPKENHVY